MHRNTESGSREHELRKLDNTTKELKGWTFNPPSIILEKTKNHVQDRGTGPSACPLLSSPRHCSIIPVWVLSSAFQTQFFL